MALGKNWWTRPNTLFGEEYITSDERFNSRNFRIVDNGLKEIRKTLGLGDQSFKFRKDSGRWMIDVDERSYWVSWKYGDLIDFCCRELTGLCGQEFKFGEEFSVEELEEKLKEIRG